MAAPEFEDGVAADRNSDQRSAADVGIIHHRGNIGGMLRHCRRTFADARVSVTAQIGQDQAISRRESLRDGQPEFMIDGKGMQQNDWRAVAQRPVGDLCVLAFDATRGSDFHPEIKTQLRDRIFNR